MIALKVSDIDPERLTIRVAQGKGGQDRYVPLADPVAGRAPALLEGPSARSVALSPIDRVLGPSTSPPPRRSPC